MLTIVDPTTRLPFPSAFADGRRCYAVPLGVEFALLVEPPAHVRNGCEAVIAVDGRDTLTNDPAAQSRPRSRSPGS